MNTQSVTIQLPERLYQVASQLAQATNRPLADILQDSLAHSLPPLEDVSPTEAVELAQLSLLGDDELWRVAQSNLSPEKQIELDDLLIAQSAARLDETSLKRLRALQDEYGRLLVRQSHAWLLLARRGYKVPVQNG